MHHYPCPVMATVIRLKRFSRYTPHTIYRSAMNSYQSPASTDILQLRDHPLKKRWSLLSGGLYATLSLAGFYWSESLFETLPWYLALVFYIAMLPFYLPLVLALAIGLDSFFIPLLIAAWTTACFAGMLAHYGLWRIVSPRLRLFN